MVRWSDRPVVLVRPLAVDTRGVRVLVDALLVEHAVIRPRRPFDWAWECPELADDWAPPCGYERPVVS